MNSCKHYECDYSELTIRPMLLVDILKPKAPQPATARSFSPHDGVLERGICRRRDWVSVCLLQVGVLL